MKKYNVILFRGLWGSVFSQGLDTLSLALKKLPNVDYVLVLPYTATSQAEDLIQQFRDKTILIGHSFGVGAFIEVANNLPDVEFPLSFSFDPSQYWYKGHKLPKNIKRCVNFWQDAPLWFIGNQQIEGAENIHVSSSHVAIDDRKDLHKKVIEEIKNA